MEIQHAAEYGQQRIEFANNVKNQEDWEKWAKNKNDFAFKFGPCWNHTTEYKVTDFASEVGFFIDVLGFDCNAIMRNYCMIQSPGGEFFFSFRPAKEDELPTPSDAMTIEFFLEDVVETAEVLKSRGVNFTQEPALEDEGSPMITAKFETPNHMPIRLWGMQKN